jgi:hypothetical protein
VEGLIAPSTAGRDEAAVLLNPFVQASEALQPPERSRPLINHLEEADSRPPPQCNWWWT